MESVLKAVILVVILTRPCCQCSFLPTQIETPSLNEIELEIPEEHYRKDFLIDLPPGTPEEEKEVPGEPLTPEDFQNAENLEILVPPMDEDSPDPIEAAGLFEGDIAGVNPADVLQKNAIRNLNQRWSGGVIPYVISAAFNTYERSVIAAAFLDYHKKTCLRFVPRSNQGDYVYLLKGVGCSSQVGRNGRRQQVSLGVGCLYKGVVIHELMHAAGFWHEQSRTDRDQYISILWRNIQPGMEYNFQKLNSRMVQTLGMQYDTDSVMHYGMYAFSRDRRSPTIVPKQQGVRFLGQRRGFSQGDLTKVNRLYDCQGNGNNEILPSTKPPTKPNACSDNNKLCPYWSGTGECRKNPNWMLANCAKSCNRCGSKCSDHNVHCARWAQLGECTKNPDYMALYCRLSCHTCHSDDAENPECEDRNKYCIPWAEDGQCRANPNYMLLYCKKSCKQC